MRVVVIGGTGHVGSYVVPRLVADGHDVVCASRGNARPYTSGAAWDAVQMVEIDRAASETAGDFGLSVVRLKPEVVVDLIGYSRESTEQMVRVLRDDIAHFLHCGTIFVMGHGVTVPTNEEVPRNAFGDYGLGKVEIEAYLLDEAGRSGFPATVLHPGQVVGEGWWPLNPAGNFNPEVFAALSRGEELALPHFGLETVHHVHADDVAQAFCNAIRRPEVAVGQSYYVVSEAAVTLRGFAEEIARFFGTEPRLRFLPWDEWAGLVGVDDRSATWEHLARSPNHSTAKARVQLQYEPRYTSLAAVEESLTWMIDRGRFPGYGSLPERVSGMKGVEA
jgi:nucleoside-diphosphate-sugar epimerase